MVSVRLLHWIFKSVLLGSLHSFLLLPEHVRTTFPCVLTCSFYKYPNELSLQHCRVVFCMRQFFTSACYVLHTFTFSSTQSRKGAFTSLIDVVLHIVCPDCLQSLNKAFVLSFKSSFDNNCYVFSLSKFSVVSLMNCPCIRFSLHFSFSSLAFCF